MLAIFAVNTNPDGTLAQVAAFLPPFSPMVVPARMVLGHMSAIALALAVALDLLATAGLILLAARIYERAILRIGAPVKLHRLFATAPRQPRPVAPRPKARNASKPRSPTRQPSVGQPRLSPRADLALRMIAVVL